MVLQVQVWDEDTLFIRIVSLEKEEEVLRSKIKSEERTTRTSICNQVSRQKSSKSACMRINLALPISCKRKETSLINFWRRSQTSHLRLNNGLRKERNKRDFHQNTQKISSKYVLWINMEIS